MIRGKTVRARGPLPIHSRTRRQPGLALIMVIIPRAEVDDKRLPGKMPFGAGLDLPEHLFDAT